MRTPDKGIILGRVFNENKMKSIKLFLWQTWLAALGCTLIGCATATNADAETNKSSGSPTDVRSGQARAGEDVLDDYVINGKDTRVSPHGKTRSSIPDEILVCDVEYENVSTGTRSTYSLEVDFADGKPVRLNFPNGGWRHVDAVETWQGWECQGESGSSTYTVAKPVGFD